jgi:hypothetical protein
MGWLPQLPFSVFLPERETFAPPGAYGVRPLGSFSCAPGDQHSLFAVFT